MPPGPEGRTLRAIMQECIRGPAPDRLDLRNLASGRSFENVTDELLGGQTADSVSLVAVRQQHLADAATRNVLHDDGPVRLAKRDRSSKSPRRAAGSAACRDRIAQSVDAV